MELFSTEFFAAFGAIILIDLVLAGDNAIVIALAARSLPKDLQKRAIFWGAVGAIGVRALMTMAVVWLLKIPGLMLAGGLLLLWIAVKLLAPGSAEAGSRQPGVTGFWAAMKTIVVADAVMGLDNVLAVAGASHGSFLLVVLGLLISIPIVVVGSTFILHWVERFPAIIYAGAAVLAWTSAKMVLGDPVLKPWVEPYAGYAWLVYVAAIAGVLLAGWLRQRSQRAKIERIALAPPANAAVESAEFVYEPVAGKGASILVPVTGGAISRAAVEHAARSVAANSGASVHLLHVLPRFNRHLGRFLSRRARDRFNAARVAAAVEPARRLLAAHGVDVRSHVRTAVDVPQEIIRVARTIGAGKIVMGSTRKSDLLRFLTGSFTGRVLDRSGIPVEVVLRGDASRWSRIAIPGGLAVAIAAAVFD